MYSDSEIRLRLRFYYDKQENIDKIIDRFYSYKDKINKNYFLKVNENHIWMHVKGETRHYYSPHLHIELEDLSEKETHIRCLFGPDATMWTLFMFLHFITAGVFLIYGTILYSNLSLNQPITTPLVIMSIMTLIWFGLYFLGRQIRKLGMPQMKEMKEILDEILG